jgi:hypothetical protein
MELPEGWIKEKKRIEEHSRGKDEVSKMASFDELFEKKKSGKKIATEEKKEMKRVRENCPKLRWLSIANQTIMCLISCAKEGMNFKKKRSL